MTERAGGGTLGCALVLAAALAVRAPLVTPTLPYLGYVDEGHVLDHVVTLLRTGGWDPHSYLYPSLTISAVTLVVRAAAPLYRLAHGHALADDLPAPGDFYDFVTPPGVILAGRLVVLAASLGIVALGILLARRLAGERAGLAAGILLAFCPALVQRSTVTNVDVVASLCALATLVLAERLDAALAANRSGRASRAALFAGLFAGLAAAAKYPAGAVLVAVLAVPLAPRGETRTFWRMALLAVAGAAAGAVLGMPAFVLHPGAVLAAMKEQSRLYADPSLFTAGGAGPSLFAQAFYRYELGILLPVLGLAGLVLLATRKETRAVAAGVLAFAVVLLAPALLHTFQPFRHALPLVPPLAIAAAALLARGTERLGSRGAPALAGVAALVVLSFVPGLVMTFQFRARRDARVRLVDWLRTAARPGQRLLVVRELAILSAELARIPAETRAASWSEVRTLAEGGGYDWLVYGRFDLAGRLAGLHDAGFENVGPFEDWLARFPVAHEEGSVPTPVYPYFWRSNEELLKVTRLGRTAP